MSKIFGKAETVKETDKSAIKKVVIVGGGTAGWMTAALLSKLLGPMLQIQLVESEDIGTVGVGEATIPPIRHVNKLLGLDEAEFLRETSATIKLAIRFENWRKQGEGYFHTFGAPGQNIAFCGFHHFWVRARQLGFGGDIWDYDLNYHCAEAKKFAHLNTGDPQFDIPYAYHFDASRYAQFLRKFSEAQGVVRTEGLVEQVQQDAQSGFISTLILKDKTKVEGDLFVDCTGFKGLLIQETLHAGYDDWSHWLQCDRAMAVPSERLPETLPYTRSIAHSAGWQWRIPLQHRNGNGLVYSSAYYSDDEAASLLLANLDTSPLGEPRIIPFKTGRRRKQWMRNVVAVGLSSGFLEPLESTSIHLIQSAIVRLIKCFPHRGINEAEVDEYNRQSAIEFEQIRDFLILHYYLHERDDSGFWRDVGSMEIPESLARKIQLFKENGLIFRENDDLFWEPSWLQVMLGQGLMPQDYHPIANSLSVKQLKADLEKNVASKRQMVPNMPTHDEFLKRVCR